MSNPRHLSRILAPLARNILGKKSPLFGKLVLNWHDIVGSEIAKITVPSDLKFSKSKKISNTAILYISTDSASAVELSYKTIFLMEKLNAFLGYQAITDIKIIHNSEALLKHQEKQKKNKKCHKRHEITAEDATRIQEKTSNIEDDALKEALEKLGQAISCEKEKK